MNPISSSLTNIRLNDQPLALITPLKQNLYDVLNSNEETVIELIRAQKIDPLQEVICHNGLEMKLIHVAATCGWMNVCKLILDAGERVDVEAKSLYTNSTFHTPLCIALFNAKFSIAEMLIEYGANIYQPIPEELNKLIAFQFKQEPTLELKGHNHRILNLNLAEYLCFLFLHNPFNETSIIIGNFLITHASSICLKKLPSFITDRIEISVRRNVTTEPHTAEKVLNVLESIFTNLRWGDLLIFNYLKFPPNYSGHIDLLYKSTFPLSKEMLFLHSGLDVHTFEKLLPLLSEDINKDSLTGDSLLDIAMHTSIEEITLSILSKSPNVKVIPSQRASLNCYDTALIKGKGKISTIAKKILDIGEGFGEILKLQRLIQLRFDFRIATKIENRLIEFDGYKSEITYPEVFESISSFFQINPHLVNPAIITFIQNIHWPFINFTTKLEAIESLNQGHPILLNSGWVTHEVSVYIDKKKNHFYVMNRGDRSSNDEAGITLYEMDLQINLDEILELLFAESSATKQFFYDIQKNPLFTKKLVLKHKDQKIGSCAWKSPKTAVRAILLSAFHEMGFELETVAVKLSGLVYKRWATDYDKMHGLAKYFNHPYHSRPQMQNEAEGIMRERIAQECILHAPKMLKETLLFNLCLFLDPLQQALFLQDTTKALEIIQSDAFNPQVKSHSYSPFHLAAKFGNKQVIEALLQKNISTLSEMINTAKPSPVHIALENNHFEIATMLIPFISEIDYCDSKTKTILSLACQKVAPEIVKQLLEQHANPCLPDTSGTLPIGYLCQATLTNSNLISARKVIFDLLFPKIELSHTDKEGGFTLLHYAVLTEDPAIFKTVIQAIQEKNCDLINNKSHAGNTALTLAIKKEFKSAIKKLTNLCADLNLVDGTATDLHEAIYTKDKEIVEYVLESIRQRGLHTLDLLNEHGNTPLLTAVILSCPISIIEDLLKAGCKVNASSTNESTPLMHAIMTNSNKTVELLLNNRADVTLADKNNWGALHYAAHYGNEEILEIILNSMEQLKCDLNSKSVSGYSPLCLSKKPSILRRLVAAGCDINCIADERSSLSNALNRGDKEMVEAFIAEGAKLSLTEGTWTDLHRAVTSENEIIVQSVLETVQQQNGNLNVKNKEGLTPLALAENTKVSVAIIDLLIKAGCKLLLN